MNRSAVIFDLDGTLTKPYLDFDALRRELGVRGPILESMERMTVAARARAEAVLGRFEREGADRAELHAGALDVIGACRDRGHPVAILTRNARPIVDRIVAALGIVVDAIRTREDGAVKPSGRPVRALCNALCADPARSWMVGDYLFDILAGERAGARTVLMIGDGPRPDFAERADFVITHLQQLPPIIAAESSESY
jgi:HAD superfamily hydrolase (TIGR01549 family)